MYYSLSISYWLTLGLSLIAAGFMVRLFIIFHDCGHGSFFKSTRANRIVGIITGTLAFTPYDRWHKDHAIHHNTVGNLDKRGIGDVWTLTVAEYEAMTPWKRFTYRVYRHPFILFGIGQYLADDAHETINNLRVGEIFRRVDANAKDDFQPRRLHYL